MKQSRQTSFLKSVISTAAGFTIGLASQVFILPLLGVAISLHQNITFAVIMTAISIARGYLLERVFEFFGMRIKLSAFMQAAIAECFRQRDLEGYSSEHDDMLPNGDLAAAGGTYLLDAGTASKIPPPDWPWNDDLWKPNGFRRDLVRGVALGIAEGEKFDRSCRRRK